MYALARSGPRDRLQVALGMLWLLDGALQLQPYMYKRGSNGLLGAVAENTMGRPNTLTDFIAFVARLMVAHQVVGNTFVALLQLAIGAILVWSAVAGRWGAARVGLGISIVWSMAVWVVGEGAGGLIFPQASMLTGAPGAALLYCLAALYLWPAKKDAGNDDHVYEGPSDGRVAVADRGLLGHNGSLIAWVLVWCGSSLLELQYGNFAPGSIPAQLRNGALGEPGWLASIDAHAASLVQGAGTVVAGVLLVAGFAAGWMVLRLSTRRIALGTGIVLASVFWVIGQNFGGIFTGSGTDPNSGPALVLLALILWPRRLIVPAIVPGRSPLPDEDEGSCSVAQVEQM
ncbi:MAG: hypothetical protein M1399_06830 [Actinobacteria bacterium]|nr:hypothetical protein [Actinomycetota bacterium]